MRNYNHVVMGYTFYVIMVYMSVVVYSKVYSLIKYKYDIKLPKDGRSLRSLQPLHYYYYTTGYWLPAL